MRRHFQRGASLPETAIVIAVVLALVFGIIDFGRFMYTYSFVANAARQGARWAMVRGSVSCTNAPNLPNCGATANDIETYVQSLSVGLTDSNKITIDKTVSDVWPGCTSLAATGSAKKSPGCIVSVQVNYPFKFILPYMPGPAYTMSSTSKMIITQ
jgi:Flp pilus assembly protein TadG